jgi:hypothetical protein
MLAASSRNESEGGSKLRGEALLEDVVEYDLIIVLKNSYLAIFCALATRLCHPNLEKQ